MASRCHSTLRPVNPPSCTAIFARTRELPRFHRVPNEMNPDSRAQPWWQTVVFYQIYPGSFADGNSDGIGDFHGITERIGHLICLSAHFSKW